MDCWLEIIREDGTLERQIIEGERVTVGRSPSADIPIPDARDLEPEHLMIAPRAEGCWVAMAQGASTPAIVRGSSFDHGMLAWGTEIQIGAIKLKVTDRLPKEKKTGEKKVSAPVLIAALVAIPAVGWMMLNRHDDVIDDRPDSTEPQLFPETVTCPETGGTPRHRADDDAEKAIAQSERYPFAAQDGIQAVQRFRRAQACYQQIGFAEAATQMERESRIMRQRIEEDYGHHRLRMRRSLEQGRLPDALVEIRALIELLNHVTGPEGDHPYLAWLKQMERRIQLRIDTAAP